MNMEKCRVTENALLCTTREGFLTLSPRSADIVHVMYSKTRHAEGHHSLVVQEDLNPFSNWSASEGEDRIELHTETLIVSYAGAEDVIRFQDKRTGKTILAEKAGNGRFVDSNDGIEQTFVSEEGEVIGGLGQQADGAMNYRGRFASLCQYNIVNAVPVLVSSKGSRG